MNSGTWHPVPPLLGPSIAIVPFVNVALLLTGFVLISPTWLTATGVPLQLPSAVTAEVVGHASVTLIITDQRLLYLNGELTTLEELPARLSTLAAKRTVLIRADRQVPIGHLAVIWDLCRQAGASHIAMATTKPAAE